MLLYWNDFIVAVVFGMQFKSLSLQSLYLVTGLQLFTLSLAVCEAARISDYRLQGDQEGQIKG